MQLALISFFMSQDEVTGQLQAARKVNLCCQQHGRIAQTMVQSM